MVAPITSFGDEAQNGVVNRVKQFFRRTVKGFPTPEFLQEHKRRAFAEPGTLNNQHCRQDAVTRIIRSFQPEAIVETGTYLGAGTKFFLSHSNRCPVFSCEINDNYFNFSQERFRKEPRIKLFKGESVKFLDQIDPVQIVPDARVLFYLDAHWHENLPLREEVEIITKKFPNALIIIDDFVVPHDPGYEHDNYGPDRELKASYLEPVLRDWQMFYPAVSAERETGAKRGACFLCRPHSKAYDVLAENKDIFVHSKQLTENKPVPRRAWAETTSTSGIPGSVITTGR